MKIYGSFATTTDDTMPDAADHRGRVLQPFATDEGSGKDKLRAHGRLGWIGALATTSGLGRSNRTMPQHPSADRDLQEITPFTASAILRKQPE